MNKLCALAVAGVLVMAAAMVSAAAPSKTTPSQRELNRKAARAERREIFRENMLLTKKEAKAFWPLFDQYEAKMDKIEARHAREVRDFVKNARNLTNSQATEKLDEVMAIKEARLKLQQQYIPKFRAILSPIKTTRFFQIDNKLRALVQCQIAQMVPLATPPGVSPEHP